MSYPPHYTACPNPFIDDWLPPSEHVQRNIPGPFAADTEAGKSSLIYKAHSFYTKVPHETIMRLILHYTEPGDLVLDGFCGTGMTGVAAQLCGSPDVTLRRSIEAELGSVHWGARKVVLQDISPSTTSIAAGLNLPVNVEAFDEASSDLLKRFHASWGWMYETTVHNNGETFEAQIDYTVWSQVYTCPNCGSEIVFYHAAFDPQSKAILDSFDCPKCGAALTRKRLKERTYRVRTLAGDIVERLEFRPVLLQWRRGRQSGQKVLDAGDLHTLRRIAQLHAVARFPSDPLPYLHRVNKWALPEKGFTREHHFWSDRALVALSALWDMARHGPYDRDTRRSLLFWIDQSLWGFAWMNRFVPTHYSHVNQYLGGVYYIPALHAEPSPRYNLEGSQPSRGKRQSLIKTWRLLNGIAAEVRISTASATKIDLPDSSVDYIFLDPPFGENFYYSDLNYLVESWHGVRTSTKEEAIIDKNVTRPKTLVYTSHGSVL
jgi:predicted RNA-binding Zn-ribbon protein involved in translation (DUF1610 family)